MDASDTHAGARIVVIADFVGEESDWITFDQRWTDLTVAEDPGIRWVIGHGKRFAHIVGLEFAFSR
jgi:hypothetical protein